MADFDFPSSPAVGDTYPDPPIEGSPVWQWDGRTWRGLVPRGAHFVETRPYMEGEFVIHDGHIYVAKRDNGPGVFDEHDWDRVVALSELTTALDNLDSKFGTSLNVVYTDLVAAINTAKGDLTSDINTAKSDLTAKFDDYLPLVGGTLTGSLTLNADPTADLEAATKKYVDDARVSVGVNAPTTPKEGDQWWDSGQGFLYVYFNGQWIAISGPAGPVGPQGPTGPQGAPGLADLNDYVPLTGAVLSGPLTLSGDPTAALHAATKQYVDALEARIAALETLTVTLESRIAALE